MDNFDKDFKPLTVQEMGRRGGLKTSQNRAHMAEIGRKGGQNSPTRFKAGDQKTKEIASLGGQTSTGNFSFNKERAAECGKLGGATRGRQTAAKALAKIQEPNPEPDVT